MNKESYSLEDPDVTLETSRVERQSCVFQRGLNALVPNRIHMLHGLLGVGKSLAAQVAGAQVARQGRLAVHHPGLERKH